MHNSLIQYKLHYNSNGSNLRSVVFSVLLTNKNPKHAKLRRYRDLNFAVELKTIQNASKKDKDEDEAISWKVPSNFTKYNKLRYQLRCIADNSIMSRLDTQRLAILLNVKSAFCCCSGYVTQCRPNGIVGNLKNQYFCCNKEVFI